MKLDFKRQFERIENGSISTEPPVVIEFVRKLRPVSIVFIAFGIGLFVWAFQYDLFWTADNKFLNAKFCLPLALSVAFVFAGSLLSTSWAKFGLWIGVAVIGQAANLQLINAGRSIHFQNYFSLSEVFTVKLVPAVIILVQFAFVALMIVRRRTPITAWLLKNFALWKLALIVSIMFFAGAAVTPDISIYLRSLLISFLIQGISLANIVLAVWSIPGKSVEWLINKYSAISAGLDRKALLGLDRFALIAATWVVVIAGLLSYFVYQSHPHVPDETQYLFQAKYMAAGQLTVKAPSVPEAFSMYMVPYKDARWHGIFPPGWPAVLALGMWLNIVWLVNPLLAGLCILLSYVLFTKLYSRRFARIGVVLLCCSPWFLFMAMSFMSHILTLVCALFAAILVYQATQKAQVIYAFGSGFFLGLLSLVRPLDAVMIAFLLGIFALLKCREWRTKLLVSSALAFGTILTAAAVLPYNLAVTGNAMVLASSEYYDKYVGKNVMAFGFGPDRGMGWGLDAFPGHSPLEAVVNDALNAFLLNTDLFGWGVGSLLLVVFLIASGGMRRKDLWALALLALMIGGYSLFWYHGGPDFGARYWFICVIPLVALTVRGMEWLSYHLTNDSNTGSGIDPRVIVAVVTICGISMVAYLPWRAMDKYYRYLEMQPGIHTLAKESGFGRSLVLIRGKEHPDYQSAWMFNPLNFEGDEPIYAWDKNPELRQKLLRSYPDRRVWIVNGPTLANGEYRIVGGPISASQLLIDQK